MRFAHPAIKTGEVHADGESYPITNGIVDVPAAVGQRAGWKPIGPGGASAPAEPQASKEPASAEGQDVPKKTRTRRKKDQEGQ